MLPPSNRVPKLTWILSRISKRISRYQSSTLGLKKMEQHPQPLIECVVLGQPVPKARPRLSRSGIAFTPKKTKDYEKMISSVIKSLYPEQTQSITGAVHVQLRIVFNRPKYMMTKKYQDGLVLHTKRPDIDNVIKAVLDALNSVLHDDAQVAKITATKYYAEKHTPARTEITVSKITQEST